LASKSVKSEPEYESDDLPAEVLPDIDWSNMSYSEAMAAVKDTVLEADADTMGDGFKKLSTKDHLIGKPFLIVRGKFSPGVGKKGMKVTLRIITADNQRFYFSDGSDGIYEQLRRVVPEGMDTFGEVHCPKGLRASRYHWDESKKMVTKEGEPNAATYYIDFS
jgi:hypothetical protein